MHVFPNISSNTSCGWRWPTRSPPASQPGSSRNAITSQSIIAVSGGCSPRIGSLRPRCGVITRWRCNASLPTPLPTQQLTLPLEPHTLAQRLAPALGAEHLLLRFRTYDEYPTEEQARWRITELLEVGFRPRRVAKLLAIQPPVVYHWKRRFDAAGLLGLTTRARTGTPLTTRVPVQAMMEVFQLLDNHPLLGHYRVTMVLDALGYRYGHTTVWQLVALYKEAHPTPKRLPNPDERPHLATAPQRVWFADVRCLVKVDGHWLYSILIFDGYSRAIVGAGCFDRQNLSRLMQVFRQAIARWGAPEAIVSDHGAVFVALQPCLDQLAMQWAPIVKGHPWQNLVVQFMLFTLELVRSVWRMPLYRAGDSSPATESLRSFAD